MMTDAILVTGVARRVGLHLARNFLDRGIPVIGTYRSERPALEDLAAKGAVLIRSDFYEEAQVADLARSITAQCGSLRAIGHNASDWIPEHG